MQMRWLSDIVEVLAIELRQQSARFVVEAAVAKAGGASH
jgi:hypothetical protein